MPPCGSFVNGKMRLLYFRPILCQLGALSNGQAKQVDKAVCIKLIVILILAEGSSLLIVQGERAGNTSVDQVALVQLQFHITGNGLLQVVGECAQASRSGVNHLPS
mgnify:CR=1 FL=1